MKIVNVAAIGGMVMERGEEAPNEAIIQFKEAAKKLDGTGVDLVVTCETMMMGQKNNQGEDPNNFGELFSEYSDFAKRNRCTLAKRNRCTLAGASRTTFDGKNRQSLVYFGPDGNILGMYHKMFPTDVALSKGVTPGDGAVVVDTPVGRLGGVLCFDLNFDELRDEYINLNPDILCFSSYFHGDHLLANWAYRTHSFLVGAIKDGTSVIYDPLGRIINSSTYYQRIAWSRINLDKIVVHGAHNSINWNAIRTKYKDLVFIDTHSLIGCAIIYSYSSDFSAKDIANEFGLIEYENYITQCRKLRKNSL